MIQNHKNERRMRRKKRIRKNLSGTPDRYRLTIYRSLTGIYAQIIDDKKGHTLVSASSRDKEVAAQIASATSKTEKSKIVGKLLADRAQKQKITAVVFDRNGYLYHGRIKALADSAREGGLQF